MSLLLFSIILKIQFRAVGQEKIIMNNILTGKEEVKLPLIVVDLTSHLKNSQEIHTEHPLL
jgi:hypothetical protein